MSDRGEGLETVISAGQQNVSVVLPVFPWLCLSLTQGELESKRSWRWKDPEAECFLESGLSIFGIFEDSVLGVFDCSAHYLT